MRRIDLLMLGSGRWVFAFAFVVACAPRHHGDGGDLDSGTGVIPCVGLACFQFDCVAKGLPPTSVSGFVYAPNGTLPLYGVNVYVPATDPGAVIDGATCSRCTDGLAGGALAQTTTDETGYFSLPNVPATTDVPIVIQIGKWRRLLDLPSVSSCQELPIVVADTTLPKSMDDFTTNTTGVDMPHIAISTGSFDALECLPRKLGIADKEISTSGQTGRIHLFANASSPGEGANQFAVGFPGGTGNFADSQALWTPPPANTGGFDTMKAYDILFLSCEGDQYPTSKPQEAMNALKAYADFGGRVFASHWHNIWIAGDDSQVQPAAHGIADWEAVASFNFGGNPSPDTLTATIDEADNPKGASFATWMVNVGGSTTKDLLTVAQARTTCTSVDPTKGEQWVYLDPVTSPGHSSSMNFQFTTPIDQDPQNRCGKVVFSDMHVSADSLSTPGVAYPGQCSTMPLTPQEKALAFMFFDIASCVGSIF